MKPIILPYLTLPYGLGLWFSLYLMVFRISVSHAQYDCSNVDPCVNLLCFNGFEGYDDGPQVDFHEELGGAWLYSGYDVNIPRICSDLNGNSYIVLRSNTEYINEEYLENYSAIAVRLQEPIEPGCSIDITFLAYRTHYLNETVGTAEFFLSTNYPCSSGNALLHDMPCLSTDCGMFDYAPECIGSIAVTTPASSELCNISKSSMSSHNLSWTNSSSESFNYLIIRAKDIPFTDWVALDDIVVTRSCPISAEFTWDANSCSVNFESNSNGNIHSWDFGDGPGSISNATNPIYTFSASGTYTVTHTVTPLCGEPVTYSESVIVTCDTNACDCEDGYNIKVTGDLIYSTSGLPSALFNKCVSITADRLIIDGNIVWLNNSQITFSAGLEVIINEGKSLAIIQGSTVQGCRDMWAGFRILPLGRLHVVNGNIYDAETAVYGYDNSYINCRHSNFWDNYIGIWLDEGINTPIEGLINNKFQSTRSLKSPRSNEFSYYGIRLRDVPSVRIQSCEFYDLEWAISVYRSIPNIQYCTFQNTSYDRFYNLLYGLNLNSCPSYMVRNNKFYNCRFGVAINGSNGKLLNNVFKSLIPIPNNDSEKTFWAIDARGLTSRRLEISDNNVFDINKGVAILLYNSQDMESLKIEKNKFYGGSRPVYIWNASAQGIVNESGIYNNVFDITGDYIHVMSSKRLAFKDNLLTPLSMNGNTFGMMDIMASENMQFRDNQLIADLKSFHGFNITNSGGLLFCCNYVDGTRGINFKDACNHSQLKTTTFGPNNVISLIYNSTAVTGDQIFNGNDWSMSGYDALHESDDPNIHFMSKYIVKKPVDYVNPSSGWFFVRSGEPASCTTEMDCGDDLWIDEGPSSADSMIATGGMDAIPSMGFVNWTEKLRLLHRIKENPTLYSASVYAAFESSYNMTELDYFADMLYDLNHLVGLSPYHSIVNQLTSELSDYQRQLDSFELVISLATPYDSALMMPDRQAMLVTIDSLQALYFSNDSLHSAYVMDKYQSQRIGLQTIIPSTDFGQAYKDYLRFELDVMINGSSFPELSWRDSLEMLTKLCYYDYGIGVFKARLLYEALFGDLEAIDWSSYDNCNAEERLAQTDKLNTQEALKVFPNPAMEQLTVFVSIDGICKLNIYSSHGDRMFNQKIVDTEGITLDLTSWSAGVYWLVVESDTDLLTEKIVIVR